MVGYTCGRDQKLRLSFIQRKKWLPLIYQESLSCSIFKRQAPNIGLSLLEITRCIDSAKQCRRQKSKTHLVPWFKHVSHPKITLTIRTLRQRIRTINQIRRTTGNTKKRHPTHSISKLAIPFPRQELAQRCHILPYEPLIRLTPDY